MSASLRRKSVTQAVETAADRCGETPQAIALIWLGRTDVPVSNEAYRIAGAWGITHRGKKKLVNPDAPPILREIAAA